MTAHSSRPSMIWSLSAPLVGLSSLGVVKLVFSALDGWQKMNKVWVTNEAYGCCVTLTLENEWLARINIGADIVGRDGVPFVKWIRRTGYE